MIGQRVTVFCVFKGGSRNGIEKNYNEVVITEDFNADLLKINEKNQISEYLDMFTGQSFFS